MRLVSIYLKGHYLFTEDQVINFGGEYIYEFKFEADKNKLKISRKNNKQFIRDFYGENVSLTSAIVGANGEGKTTLINTIVMNFISGNNGIIDCEAIVFIFEVGDSVKVLERHYGETNFSREPINFKFSILDNKNLATIYYTPILDIREFYINNTKSLYFDLSKYRFFQKDTEEDNGSFTALSEFHLSENLKRWIIFRKDFNLDFKNIPNFNRIKINVNRVFSITSESNFDDASVDFRKFAGEFYEKWRDEYHNKATNKRKLELNIILSVIEKIFKILEGTGNTYLREGRVGLTLERIKNLNLENSLYLFLDNHYFVKEGSQDDVKVDIRLPIYEIKELIKTLLQNLPDENEIQKNHWTEYEVGFDAAVQIINAYQKFITSFSENFTHDKTILLTFKPEIDLSSGEKGLLDLFSSFNSIKKDIKPKNILIFIDEGDATFHPSWKVKFVNSIINILPKIFENKMIQIVFTTHDSLTLSDITDSNIVYLKNRKILIGNDKPTKSFGANITDLLAHSFFITEGLIGDFAKEKISITLEWLKSKANEKRKKDNQKDLFEICENITMLEFKNESDEIEYHKKIIKLVDEPLVKQKLKEMFIEFVSADLEFKNEQIRELENKLNKLKGE